MTAEIISLDTWKADQEPHWEGRAKCLECGNIHHAVAPAGVTQMECLACGLEKAAWMGLMRPATWWRCGCGNDLFYVEAAGCLCAKCGARQAFPD